MHISHDFGGSFMKRSPKMLVENILLKSANILLFTTRISESVSAITGRDGR
jgi:hypothetical protein